MESFLHNISVSELPSKCSQRASRTGMLYMEVSGRDVPRAEVTEKFLAPSEKKF